MRFLKICVYVIMYMYPYGLYQEGFRAQTYVTIRKQFIDSRFKELLLKLEVCMYITTCIIHLLKSLCLIVVPKLNGQCYWFVSSCLMLCVIPYRRCTVGCSMFYCLSWTFILTLLSMPYSLSIVCMHVGSNGLILLFMQHHTSIHVCVVNVISSFLIIKTPST